MQVVLFMLGVAAVGALVGFAIRRWGALYLLAAMAVACSVAIVIHGSSNGDGSSSAHDDGSLFTLRIVFVIVVLYWLPFGIGMASGIALRRKRRADPEN